MGNNVTFFRFSTCFSRYDCYVTSKLADRDNLNSSRLILRGFQRFDMRVVRELCCFRQEFREACGPSSVRFFFVSTAWIPMKWSCIALSRIQNSTSRMPRVWQIAKHIVLQMWGIGQFSTLHPFDVFLYIRQLVKVVS